MPTNDSYSKFTRGEKRVVVWALVFLLVLGVALSVSVAPPVPTSTPTHTPTPTSTSTLTATPGEPQQPVEPTAIRVLTFTPAHTPVPTHTASPTVAVTLTPTPHEEEQGGDALASLLYCEAAMCGDDVMIALRYMLDTAPLSNFSCSGTAISEETPSPYAKQKWEQAIRISDTYQQYKNPAPAAIHAYSYQDLTLDSVQAVIQNLTLIYSSTCATLSSGVEFGFNFYGS